MFNIFSNSYLYPCIFLVKYMFKYFAPSFSKLLPSEFCDFNKFWRQNFHHICDLQLFLLPACNLSHFLNNVFEEHKPSFLFFFSLWIMLLMSNLRNLCVIPDYKAFFQCFLQEVYSFRFYL